MFRKFGPSFAAGIALTLSLPSFSWADEATGVITFTADNAAQIFINGESLGQTNNWTQPFEFDVEDLNLQQGTNVIGIAAWDSEGIAAMSGEFVMPDSTEFGTSDEGWFAFPADQNPRSNNSAGNPYNKNQEDPLVEYKDILDVPPDWNTVDYEVSNYLGKAWREPGSVNENTYGSTNKFPWGKGTTGDPTWLWIGENSTDTKSDWWRNNFVLFRFEFICVDEFCNSDVGWEENQIIDIDSRSYDDIIGSSSAGLDANTYPYFAGGTLSFEGFAGGEYVSDFYLEDNSGNTIDNAGVNPELTGVLAGPGGMIFKGEGTTTLSGENTYEGLTTVENGTLQITSINGLGSADAGTRVENGAFLRISVSGQKSDPGTHSENDARINEEITLAGGELDLDGNYIDLRGGVVLEGEGVNSTIRVKKGSTEVSARSGKVTGQGGLIKEGEGYLRLATSLEYEGETIIEKGELGIANTTKLPQTTSVSVKEEGTLRLVGEGNEVQSLTGDGSIILRHDVSILTSGLSGNNDEFSGVISGKGGFTKAGTGTTTFAGSNTYTGATNIESGTLKVTGMLSDATAVTVASGATYDVYSTDEIGSIAGAGSVDLANEITLTAGGDDSSTEVEGVISGAGSFAKAGNGTTTFSGDKTYTGATNITEGTLKVTGTLSNETSVTVASGATYEVDSTDEIGSLAGSGSVELANGITLTAGGNESSTEFAGVISGSASFAKAGGGTTHFSGDNTYIGETNINQGTLQVSGSLSDYTAVTVAENAIYKVDKTDEIGSIEGDGSIVIADDQILTAGGLKTDTAVSGIISGGGGFTKIGDGITTFAGANTYQGPTTIEDGFLSLTNFSGIPQGSSTLVTGVGRLDLVSGPTGDGQFEIDRLSIKEGGRVLVSPSHPLVSKSITLDANPAQHSRAGGIVTFLDARDNPPLRVSESFNYESGSLVVATPNPEDPEGVWQIIDGKVENVERLASNTYIVVSDDQAYPFEGIGEDFGVDGPALYKGYLSEGSLNLVIEKKSTDELICDLNPDADGCEEEEPDKPVVPPIPPIGCEGDDCQTGNELPDADDDEIPDLIDTDDDNDGIPDEDDPDADSDDDGIPDFQDPDADGDGELDDLPGCEVGDDLCDVISDSEGDEDEALEDEEEVAVEIIDALLDGVEDEEIDLTLSFDYGQLARLVGSGLAPRNVDAAGRGLALHNNLLVDTLFERQPLRQFEELVAEEVVDESVIKEEAVIEEAAPVQPLWLKTEGLSDGEAAEYVEGAVEGVEVSEVEVANADLNGAEAVAIEVEEDAVVVEFDGVSLVDLQDDELDLAKRDGVSAWVKGFGGNSRADESSILYNDYDLNAYGTSFGVDVALSETFQIGAYANYGDLNVNHRSGETGGGSWNPEGWGGGLTAQYSTRHFYVQGLLGASEFSGEQSRNILRINEDLGGNTARGDKSVTSYLAALRIGAPFKTGGVVLEPQGQVVWTRNHEQGFSETGGTEKNLRLKYKSRTTNFAETELGMKLSVPIRTGERGLLVPSLRAAWLADWNQANEGQEIGYKFTKKTVNFDSQLGTENGALIEAGLDYTVQNFNGISVKLYGRGGMEFWASDRGTTWRASGGVTFQF